jgi:F0F1-type ATP synthase assembly protein I
MLCAARRVASCSHMKAGPELPGLGRYMALGIQMVVVTAVIAAIGYWLDRKTGRTPLFLIVFFFLGALAGIAVVWRELYKNDK